MHLAMTHIKSAGRHVCLFLILILISLGSAALQDAPNKEPKYFVEELATLDLTLKDWVNDMIADFGNEMGDMDIDDIINFIDQVLSPKLRIVAISYNTRDHFGNPVLGTELSFTH